jgi:hypothetical protein
MQLLQQLYTRVVGSNFLNSDSQSRLIEIDVQDARKNILSRNAGQ